MRSLKTIFIAVIVGGMAAITPFSMGGKSYSDAPLLNGSKTECTDFRLGDLLSFKSTLETLGITEVFDIDITDEGWVWVNANEPFKSVTGVVKRSHHAPTDLSANHNSHDQIADILVDAEYLGLVSDVNADHSDADDIGGQKIADSIEMEWEGGIDPETLQEGISGAPPYFPKWAWPSIGDRIWVDGHWVIDCGHGTDVAGEPHYRSEIHPARALASMREQLFTLPETGTTPVFGIATDLYIHGQSGYMVAQLNCGMDLIFSDDPDGCPIDSTPINVDFSFNITLPAKPHASAILATFIEDGPGNTVNIAPDLDPLPVGNPTVVEVTIPLEGTGVTPDDIYSRKIYTAWVYPPNDLEHHSLTLDMMDLYEDKDQDPGNCECTFFFLNIGRSGEDEWIRLSDFTTVDPDDDFDEDNMNAYDDNFASSNGEMGFTGADFDYYISDGMPINIYTNGYDQDCLDDWMGNHYFNEDRYLDCYVDILDFTNYGDSDRFVRANATLVAQDYECRPGSSVPPTESGKQYTLCTSNDGQVHLSVGTTITIVIGEIEHIIPVPEYELYFTLDEIPLTNEDTADLSLDKTCKPGTAQSFICTIIVENFGPGLPKNVVIEDILTTDAPAGSYTFGTPKYTIENSYKTGPFDCTVTPPDQFSCSVGTIPVEGRANITFTVTATQPGDFDDSATVSTDSTDPNSENDEDQFKVIVVDIDVKPGDAKNTISINNDKTVRVAILGSETLDVSSIDISPLSDAPKFGGKTPRAPVTVVTEDVNKDGIMDLVMKFNEGPKNPLGLRSGDNQGCITGKLIDGTPILGCDVVRVIK